MSAGRGAEVEIHPIVREVAAALAPVGGALTVEQELVEKPVIPQLRLLRSRDYG